MTGRLFLTIMSVALLTLSCDRSQDAPQHPTPTYTTNQWRALTFLQGTFHGVEAAGRLVFSAPFHPWRIDTLSFNPVTGKAQTQLVFGTVAFSLEGVAPVPCLFRVNSNAIALEMARQDQEEVWQLLPISFAEVGGRKSFSILLGVDGPITTLFQGISHWEAE